MNRPDYFQTVESTIRGPELRVKGSRFIPDIRPVATKKEVEDALSAVRREFHDATHHCFAYRLGVTGELLRAADDGEPSGTAGRPILLMLTNAKLTNSLLIVTRYFGGTMLGTGGLARAYADAAKQVIAQAKIRVVYLTDSLRLNISFEDLSHAERLLAAFEITARAAEYSESVTLTVEIRKSLRDKFIATFTEALNGRVQFSSSSEESPSAS